MKKILYIGNKLHKHGFTPTSVETLGERLKEDFIIVQRSPFKNPILRIFDMWISVVRYRNANFLLIDTYSSSAFWFAYSSARLARFLHLNYIPILHGGNLPNRAKQSPKQMLYYLSKAYKVVCPSNYLIHEMRQFYDRRYELIPNFIHIENYVFNKKEINEDKINLLWVRSFHKTYNPQLAIKVLKDLHNQGFTNTKLCMVGPDKDGTMDQCSNMAEKLDMMKYLKITGRLSKTEWIELSKAYNIFINTTNYDNTPVSVMEAMALGFPIVTTNVGGIPHLFKNQKEGIMVPPDNCEAFVTAIIHLATNPKEAETIAQNARKKAESWDWSEIKLSYTDILNNKSN